MSKSLRDAVVSWIESELRKMGFEVSRNAIVEREGFRHRLDVLAQATLLGSVRLRIGFIVFERKVDVEALEKAIAWRDVLGLDKIVAVAIAGSEKEVAALALKKGVDLLYVPEHIAEKLEVPSTQALCAHIEPAASLEEARERLASIARGGLFKKSRPSITRVVTMFLPIAMLRVEVQGVEEGEVVEGVVSVDGVKGFPVRRKGSGIAISVDEGSLATLDPNALRILELLKAKGGSATLDELARELGEDLDRVRELVEELSSRNLVDVYGDVVELRGLELEGFANVEDAAREVGAQVHAGAPSEGVDRVVLGVSVDLGFVERVIEALGGRVLGVKVVFYPLFAALIEERKNGVVHERLVAVDGLSLGKVEGFDEIGCDPSIIELVKGVSTQRAS